MNAKEQTNFILVFKKLQQCADLEEEIIKGFLGKTFEDLVLRAESNNKMAICGEILASYLDLPGYVSDKIFSLFDEEEKGLLDKEDFVNGMYSLYFSSLKTLKKSTFEIFDFNHDGKIHKEDVQMIFNYLNTSDLVIEDLEGFIEGFFGGKNFMAEDKFDSSILYLNSDILIIFLILLYSKQPFSEESIKFYMNNCESMANNTSFNPNKIKRTETNFTEKICRPSVRLNFYLKLVRKPFSGTRRRNGSKNVNNFGGAEIQQKFKDMIFNQKDSEVTGIENSEDHNPAPVTPRTRSTTINSKCSFNIANPHCDYKSSVSTKSLLDRLTESAKDCYFTAIAYKMSSEDRLKKFKLVIVDKVLFTFKFVSSLSQYVFDRVVPLTGYYVTALDMAKVQTKESWPFVLLASFGSTMANLSNIFFMKTKAELESCIEAFKRSIDQKIFDDHYTLIKEIGQGQYGKVMLAQNIQTREQVAVKLIRKSKLKEKEVKIIRSEIDVLKNLKLHPHPNIVQFIDVFEDNFHIYIVMECLYGGSLTGYLNKNGKILKDNEIKSVAAQIAKGLQFLHSKGIVHRDIKTDNIMLVGKDVSIVKIVDFGLSKIMSSNERAWEGYGTLVYTAPEILSKIPYCYKIDVWSLGVLVYYLLTGLYPFDGEDLSMTEIAKKICKSEVAFPERVECNKELKAFVNQCFQKCNIKRLSISQILDLKLL